MSLEQLLKDSLAARHGAQGEPVTASSGYETPGGQTRLISATRIAAIVGVAPKSWKATPLTVWREMVLGEQPKRTKSELARLARGNRLEPYVRGLYLEETGAELLPQYEVHAHPEHGWATCSPDALVDVGGDRAVVDLKTWSRHAAHHFGPGDSDIPDQYAVQLAWSMFVLDLPASYLYVAFGEDDDSEVGFSVGWTRLYRISRDPELEHSLFEAGRNFWARHVLTKLPPEE